MPEIQIDSRLLLDLLLVFIVLLFVPFGIRRGVAKEAMVSAGILLGALVGSRWATAGGTWLATSLGLDQAVAAFAVALAALLGGTFLIGYGAGSAVGDVHPGFASRLAGGLLAALNGVFFLSYLLQTIEQWLAPGDALDDGLVTGMLLRRFDDLLLVAAGVVVVLIVAGWIVRAVRGPRPVAEVAMPPRSRPVRVAPVGDAGKFEPELVPSGRPTGAYAAETAPLPADPSRGGNPWQRPFGASSANGHAATGGAPAEGDWMQRPGDPVGAGRNVWSQAAADGGRRFGVGGGAEGTVEERRRCPTCGAVADPDDLYCQQCGKTL